ncbi:MAG: hypothetical protein K0Q76_3171 [Panacagrimonas sp.]|jgi:hypothetical protein|nr:hypothetical protein [Panacagrimonas sp.]MCC2658063.1 hypothetical protein [Panacagrimonas sp.]
MKSLTDTLLIVAIVIGLIAAASLPVVSVNAISSDALRLHDARREAPPWSMIRDDAQRRRVAAWREASLMRTGRGKGAPLGAAMLDPVAATPAPH